MGSVRSAGRWLAATRLRQFLAILAVMLVTAGVATAISSGGSSSSGPTACAIVETGQKLCDGDLAAYCRGFEQGSLAQGTVEACAEVGVDVLPASSGD